MKISLIIPAYNEEKYIGRCLESVSKFQNNFFEVIVVNNASIDTTPAICKEYPFVKVIDETKKGLPFARSRGLREATGDIVAFIDADAEIPNGWAEQIQREFEKNKDIICLSGPYIYYDQKILGRIFVWIYWKFLGIPTYFFTGYMLVAGNFAAKKSAMETIGGFDTNILFYGDDTDIARKLSRIGKVKFSQSFIMYTSARRLKNEGVLKTAYHYIINFLGIVLMKKPITSDHSDIR